MPQRALWRQQEPRASADVCCGAGRVDFPAAPVSLAGVAVHANGSAPGPGGAYRTPPQSAGRRSSSRREPRPLPRDLAAVPPSPPPIAHTPQREAEQHVPASAPRASSIGLDALLSLPVTPLRHGTVPAPRGLPAPSPPPVPAVPSPPALHSPAHWDVAGLHVSPPRSLQQRSPSRARVLAALEHRAELIAKQTSALSAWAGGMSHERAGSRPAGSDYAPPDGSVSEAQSAAARLRSVSDDDAASDPPVPCALGYDSVDGRKSPARSREGSPRECSLTERRLRERNEELQRWNEDLQNELGVLSSRLASLAPSGRPDAWERRARELEAKLQDKRGMCESLLERVRGLVREEEEQRQRHAADIRRLDGQLQRADDEIAALREAAAGSPGGADVTLVAGLEAENARLRLLCDEQDERLTQAEAAARAGEHDAEAARAEADREMTATLEDMERACQGRVGDAEAERAVLAGRAAELEEQLAEANAAVLQLKRVEVANSDLRRALDAADCRREEAERMLEEERRERNAEASEWEWKLGEAKREGRHWHAECKELRRIVNAGADGDGLDHPDLVDVLSDSLSDLLWLADVLSGAARGCVDEGLLMGNCEQPAERARRVEGATAADVAHRVADTLGVAKMAAMDALATRMGDAEAGSCAQQ